MKPGAYQHRVDMICMKRGLQYHGCFRNSQDAKDFIEQKRKEGYELHMSDSKIGAMPYGTWKTRFNVERYMAAQGEWLGDYKVTGRD